MCALCTRKFNFCTNKTSFFSCIFFFLYLFALFVFSDVFSCCRALQICKKERKGNAYKQIQRKITINKYKNQRLHAYASHGINKLKTHCNVIGRQLRRYTGWHRCNVQYFLFPVFCVMARHAIRIFSLSWPAINKNLIIISPKA